MSPDGQADADYWNDKYDYDPGHDCPICGHWTYNEETDLCNECEEENE